jgi:hypothetical protein
MLIAFCCGMHVTLISQIQEEEYTWFICRYTIQSSMGNQCDLLSVTL